MEEAITLNQQLLLFGLDSKSSMTVYMIFLDMLIVAVIVWLGSIGNKRRPNGAQNLVEWTVMYICNYADSIIGRKDAQRYYPLLVMLFLYILIGNLLGLVPGLTSPTASLSVTVTLAVGVWLFSWFEGLTRKGPVKFFAHFTGGPAVPMIIKPFIFFIELLSDISRMISLSFRLFGNIVAKEVLLSVLVLLVLLFWPSVKSNALGIVSINGMIFSIAAILRPLIIWLGVLISVIQAGVFTLLTATYIAGAAVSHEEHSAE